VLGAANSHAIRRHFNDLSDNWHTGPARNAAAARAVRVPNAAASPEPIGLSNRRRPIGNVMGTGSAAKFAAIASWLPSPIRQTDASDRRPSARESQMLAATRRGTISRRLSKKSSW
jgi:hypothetical protein